MRRLVVAAALAAGAILAVEVAPTREIGLAVAVALFVLGMIYEMSTGIIVGLRELRTVRFWIVVAGLVLVSLATLKLH